MNRRIRYCTTRGFAKGKQLYLWVIAVQFLLVYPASAQMSKQTCPQLAPGATAAEQVVCWFQLEKSDSPECAAQNDDASPCISQTNAWCAEASLDEEPVTTACLLAAIRAGNLKEAKVIAGYLPSSIKSKTAETCVAILKRADIRIVTNPAGAEVIVNGRSYGNANAPKDVRLQGTLQGDWWESEIKTRFATDAEMVEIAVSSEEILNALDREECVFGDVVVTGPKLEPPALPQTNQADVGLNANRLSVDSSDSDWLLWTSISLAVAGVASGVVATLYYLDGESDFDYLKKACPGGCNEKYIDSSSMDEKYAIGNLLAITGSICLAAAVATGLFYFADANREKEKASTDVDIHLNGLGLALDFKGRYD